MDRVIHRRWWSPGRWSLLSRSVALTTLLIISVLVSAVIGLKAQPRSVRLPARELSFASVEAGTFHDLIPLRATVAPRETVYVDAMDGGRVDRVLVQAGDFVHAGTPLVELSNTNMQLQVMQQESQLNQAISQLDQNEIALEQTRLSNERDLVEIDYQIQRLGKSASRREVLATSGGVATEQFEDVADQLAYYRRLRPIINESARRQSELHDRLLPAIHDQLSRLHQNLAIARRKLDGLIVRSPVAGRVTAIDLTVGESRSEGQRLAEITSGGGLKLTASLEEYYLPRVKPGLPASLDVNGIHAPTTITRIYPLVRAGRFAIDLGFTGTEPPDLVAGQAAQGSLQLGEDAPALILEPGAFLDQSGGDSVFVVSADGLSATRRRIRIGRRNPGQLEILAGLAAGEQVIVSDYSGLDRVDRITIVKGVR